MQGGQKRRLLSTASVVALVAAGFIGALATQAGAAAATFYIQSDQDGVANAANCPANNQAGSSACRLRDAIAAAAANAGDDTLIAASGLTTTLTADLEYTDNDKITVQGTGGFYQINGDETFAGFRNLGLGSLAIDHVGIFKAHSTSNDGSPGVGAIFVNGSVTMTNSFLADNAGTNTSNGQGVGGILTGGSSSVTITNSTLDSNTGTGNTAVGVGGVLSGGPVTVTGSTFSDNEATSAFVAVGGLSDGNTSSITNSTFNGNSADAPVYAAGAMSAGGVELTYATIVGNTGADAANVSAEGFESFGSVVASGIDGDNCDVAGTNSDGYNYEDTDTCGFDDPTDNAGSDTAPGLGELADNGGPTHTMLPQTGSPLIDQVPAASPCGGVNITEDQRGEPRPTAAPGLCDIGAVELQPAPAGAPLVVTFTG